MTALPKDALPQNDVAIGAGFAPIVSGDLEVRLAREASEVEAAQRLRYRVFVDELGAKPDAQALKTGRDADKFDEYCDHLLVLDRAKGDGPAAIVGTYRLLRRSVAQAHDGFYTATEFDIARLESVQGEILELGRSCVDAEHRTRAVMQLLWKGIAAYAFRHDIKIMFGCASLPGVNPKDHAAALSYLHHNHLAPEAIRVRALPERYVDMNLLPASQAEHAAAAAAFDARAVIAALPPLIKGYLRLGGFVGEGAVIDREFNTIDVCILVVTDDVTAKYLNHYSRTTGRTG
jgi:L-ornithine Nalpha-acyltransferase